MVGARGRALEVAVSALLVCALVPVTASGEPTPGQQGPSLSRTDDRATTVEPRLRKAVRVLEVRHERRKGYDRDLFEFWTDDDGDGCDTRAEVLTTESAKKVTVNEYCTVQTGRWRSYYDRATWREGGDLDIDHLVPLAEAWDSGARGWTAGTRRRFANDLRDRRSLVAVTASVNRSKGDRDFAQWRPEFGRCRYLQEWAVVKTRWDLTVNRAESKALRRAAVDCPNRRLRIRLAKVERR